MANIGFNAGLISPDEDPMCYFIYYSFHYHVILNLMVIGFSCLKKPLQKFINYNSKN